MEHHGSGAATVSATAGQSLNLEGVKPASSITQQFVRNLYDRMSSDAKRTVLALVTTIMPSIFFQLWLHNFLLSAVVFVIPFLGWGIRLVPKYHNGLLSILWVRRTRIGFFEGVVWVPWFLGTKLSFYDTRKRQLDIPEEDNWTTDSMHLVYDIVLQYGIMPVQDDGFWKNFFQFFICVFKRRNNADSLYYFSDQIDLKSAITIMSSMTADYTIRAVNSRNFEEIFQQEGDGKPKLKESTIQEQVISELNAVLTGMGLRVYMFNLKDVDFHEDTAAVLQEKFLGTVRGQARERLYDVIAQVAKKLVAEGQEVTDAAIRIETVEALKSAADGDGIIGMLLQSMIAKNTLSGQAIT